MNKKRTGEVPKAAPFFSEESSKSDVAAPFTGRKAKFDLLSRKYSTIFTLDVATLVPELFLIPHWDTIRDGKFEDLGSCLFAYKLHYLQFNIGLASEKAAIIAFLFPLLLFVSPSHFCVIIEN